jgi:hypothetical protein
MKYKQALWYAVDGCRISFRASKKELHSIVTAVFDILIGVVILSVRVGIVLTFPISMPIIALFIMVDNAKQRRDYEELIRRAARDSYDVWGGA